MRRRLYSEGLGQVTVRASDAGRDGRVASFNLAARTIDLNESHPFVSEYADQPAAHKLLEDFGISEALLEVYLREAEIPPSVVGELLGRRDELLKSLVDASAYAPITVAERLRESTNDERDLEVYLIRGVRILGLNAKQVSGAGEPDGVATWHDYGTGRARRITLEAKSSEQVPTLGNLDFAGLRSHADAWGCEGCLLIAPSYPGETREQSEVDRRSAAQKVSCWTVEDFASVVEQAERLRINAQDLMRIVTAEFQPANVSAAVGRLLARAGRAEDKMIRVVLDPLWKLRRKSLKSQRTVDLIHGSVLGDDATPDEWEPEDTRRVVRSIRVLSKGLLELGGDDIILLGTVDQLRARVLTEGPGEAVTRSANAFRQRQASVDDDELRS